jgi:hypothetical protein
MTQRKFPHSPECVGKARCLKQVNPYLPEHGYFGIPYRYDPHWLACRQCHNDPVEVFRPEEKTLPAATTRFRRGN